MLQTKERVAELTQRQKPIFMLPIRDSYQI